MIIIGAVLFAVGALFGASLWHWAFNVGSRAVFAFREGEPLNAKPRPTDQESTEDAG